MFYVSNSKIHGKGLFTNCFIPRGFIFDTPGHPFGGLNHSCNPNSIITNNPFFVKTLKDILPNEEITVYYIYDKFNCNCFVCKLK